jgi:purine nucleosidase
MATVPVLLDTDIGSDIDDGIALAYLIAEARCDLRGVTTVSGQPRLRAALVDAVCRAGGVTDVPIHAGAEHAIVGDTPQPDVPQAAVLERFDHRPAEDFGESTAVTFLRDVILAAPGEITLLTIGPLTNAGLLFATYPEVVPALRSLVVMGGAYSSSRWIGGGQEWNTFCDPTAAHVVYRTPVKDHRSLGLNVTTRCTMPSGEVVSRFKTHGGALEVVAAMTEVWAEGVDAVTFHDPLAAVSVIEPDVCTWQGGRVSVELTSRRFRGATSFDVDREGSPHLVAETVDPARFFDVLLGTWQI